MKHSIFVVDDHPVFREGIVRIINQGEDLVVCGEASDVTEARKQIETLKPDLVTIDISLNGSNGIDLVKSLRKHFPKLCLLVLSMQEASLQAERALRAGANGYVSKIENGQTILSAIRQVLDGKTYIGCVK